MKYDRNAPIPCPKCGFETNETKELSMSTKTHKYGRQNEGDKDDMSDRYYAWQSMTFFYYFSKRDCNRSEFANVNLWTWCGVQRTAIFSDMSISGRIGVVGIWLI